MMQYQWVSEGGRGTAVIPPGRPSARRPVTRSNPHQVRVARQGCIEIPALVVFTSSAGATGRRPQPIRVVRASVEGDQIFRVVELCTGLLEFAFVHLKRGIERGVLLDVFEEIRIDAGGLVERFVALLERFCAQWFVG
jgi:hypothetical protein